MAQLVVQEPSGAGIIPSYAAASAGGDTVVVNDKTFIHVKNGGGGSITVTVPKAVTVLNQPGFGDIAIADISVAIAAGAEKMISLDPGGHAPGGVASVGYSGVTSVTVGVFRLPKV